MDDFEQFLSKQPLRAPPPAWRVEILAAAAPEGRVPAQPAPWWRNWLWPSPAPWLALAGAWVAIFCLNAAAKRSADRETASHPGPSVDQIAAVFVEERQMMDELTREQTAAATPPAPTPATTTPSHAGASLTPFRREDSDFV